MAACLFVGSTFQVCCSNQILPKLRPMKNPSKKVSPGKVMEKMWKSHGKLENIRCSGILLSHDKKKWRKVVETKSKTGSFSCDNFQFIIYQTIYFCKMAQNVMEVVEIWSQILISTCTLHYEDTI